MEYRFYLKHDSVVSSAAKKLFPDAVAGYIAVGSTSAQTHGKVKLDMDAIDVSEDEYGLCYDYGDVVVEFPSDRFIAFTTSQWSRIMLIPLTIIEKV
jgi:hypothetical protein